MDAAGEVGVGVYIGTDGSNTLPELPTPIAPNQANEELFLEG